MSVNCVVIYYILFGWPALCSFVAVWLLTTPQDNKLLSELSRLSRDKSRESRGSLVRLSWHGKVTRRDKTFLRIVQRPALGACNSALVPVPQDPCLNWVPATYVCIERSVFFWTTTITEGHCHWGRTSEVFCFFFYIHTSMRQAKKKPSKSRCEFVFSVVFFRLRVFFFCAR